jgi:hypothetical protein
MIKKVVVAQFSFKFLILETALELGLLLKTGVDRTPSALFSRGALFSSHLEVSRC